jgi:two-component system chemotaxis response regulator CheB
VPTEHRLESTKGAAAQFDVVAIGASAGGVEALHIVAEALPAEFPAAVLVVQHMDPATAACSRACWPGGAGYA